MFSFNCACINDRVGIHGETKKKRIGNKCRFLANKYNLAGRTNLERAQADEIVDTITDLFKNVYAVSGEGEERQKKVN